MQTGVIWGASVAIMALFAVDTRVAMQKNIPSRVVQVTFLSNDGDDAGGNA